MARTQALAVEAESQAKRSRLWPRNCHSISRFVQVCVLARDFSQADGWLLCMMVSSCWRVWAVLWYWSPWPKRGHLCYLDLPEALSLKVALMKVSSRSCKRAWCLLAASLCCDWLKARSCSSTTPS